MKREQRRYTRLAEALAGARRALILLHDHPDPDALAGGLLLRRILRRGLRVAADIGYGGRIGRAENQAMVRELRIPLIHRAQLRGERYDALALVDTQPGSGNHSLPEGLRPEIVFDHHPLRRSTREAVFSDVRPGFGAVSTILFEYLQPAGLAPDRRLATAVFHAIRSETQNLGREGTPADARVFTTLFPLVDNRRLARIEQAPVSPGYLGSLSVALRTTRLFGEVAVARLGRVPYPDAPAQLADFLLRVEGVEWVLACGMHQRRLYLSLRAERHGAQAGRVLRRIVGDRGRAGGHGSMAGGRIDLDRAASAATEEARLERRAREILGVAHSRPRPLMPGRACPPR
ncbi:MAG: hypothetical protein FJY75_01725 [Candidatus Eisenbacteria bacterium]|uniref:Uncharacterized protein n=1 Tax=Eiseniibacteriota bacterium TaxID=2212470 RepID=A0A937X8Q1_UNCEI|nr:hypothetical protein [Candidatus Eisenbacteria bacterium]